MSSAKGFLDVYKAQCAYIEVPASQEFIFHVTGIADQGSVELDITNCPGLILDDSMRINQDRN